MPNDGGEQQRHSILDNTRLMTLVTTVAMGLGMWWLQNTWSAIREEARAREQMMQTIAQTFANKEAIQESTANRQHQIQLLSARLDSHERLMSEMRSVVSRIETDVATIKTMIGMLHEPPAKSEPKGRSPFRD